MKTKILKKLPIITAILALFLTSSVKAGPSWPFLPDAYAKKDSYNMSGSNLYPKVLTYIQKNYVEPSRISYKEMFKGALNDLQKSVPEILVNFQSPTSFTLTIDKSSKRFSSSLKNINEFWKTMKEVFIFTELNYKGDVELKDIEAILIDGALRTLDPHSAILTPEIFNEFNIDTSGQFGGLGIVITSKDGQLTVITPIEDTPAWKAGIRSGDVITQIGDESTINMSLTKAVERLRGRIGTKVTITVERKGRAQPFDITLTRAKIQIDSIKSSLIKDDKKSVGYIRVKRFQRNTGVDFFKQLKILETDAGKSFKGLVIDLRNNPGGLLNEAIKIADTFIANGVIVSTVGANRRFIDEDVAHVSGTEPNNYPIVVLVNEGSASASEIVAGALQAHKRALVVGAQTFGKGSVQSVYELGRNYALKLTVAQYLTAGKHSIQTKGIIPDLTISPAIAAKEVIDIWPNKSYSEKELKKHLNQIIPSTGKETRVIKYYQEYVNEDKIEELRRKEYSEKIDFKDDFAVKLASKIIMDSKSSDPQIMLKESGAIISKLETMEEEKISSELSKLGTTWNGLASSKTTKLSASSSLKKGKLPVTKANAGEEIKLVLRVTNTGKNPTSKLIGIIEAENPLLSEKEFVFGKLLPGESASREITLDVPDGLNSRNIPYTVNFKEGKKDISYKYKSAFSVIGYKEPHFSFMYELGKPKTVGAKHPLPRNKSVPLTVKIKNIGKGPTKDLQAYISNKKVEKGIFIEKGRDKLGVIKPGETKKAVFSFKVLPSMKNSSFIFELTMGDRELLEFLTVELDITIESGAIEPAPGIWYEGPSIALINKDLPILTNANTFNLRGSITDDKAIKDYYIFVDEDKSTYKSNPHEKNTLNINEVIKLKKGNNNITIVTRDNNKLTTRKSFVIQKGDF